jgi:enoyl-CoA hydratase/carnithine racemase
MIGEFLRAASRPPWTIERVVGIVVTGARTRLLCRTRHGGSSLKSAHEGDASAGDQHVSAIPTVDDCRRCSRSCLDVPKPVIAAVNGVAAGGGFVLAMMCDLRFAAETGGSFTTSFSKRGLVAEHGTSWLLPRLVGTSRALDLLWSSRRFDAAEAYRIGLADRVVPDAQLLDEAAAYVRGLAETVAPRSLALMKQQVLRGWSQPIDVALRQVDAEMQRALGHPDATEGVASFVERRPPQFAPWTPEQP